MKMKNICFFVVIVFLSIIVSYLMYDYGVTEKLVANLNNTLVKIKNIDEKQNSPVIDILLNSSGESITNTDVVITIMASSNYNIKKIEYSYDLKKWYYKDIKTNSNKINDKIIFKSSMNKYIYIRVIDSNDNKSYAYKTKINIDKQKPSIKVEKNNDNIIIKAVDNNEIKYLQYSKDLLDWTSYEVNKKNLSLYKKSDENIYYRVVDKVGNISDIKKVY